MTNDPGMIYADGPKPFDPPTLYIAIGIGALFIIVLVVLAVRVIRQNKSN